MISIRNHPNSSRFADRIASIDDFANCHAAHAIPAQEPCVLLIPGSCRMCIRCRFHVADACLKICCCVNSVAMSCTRCHHFRFRNILQTTTSYGVPALHGRAMKRKYGAVFFLERLEFSFFFRSCALHEELPITGKTFDHVCHR